MSKIIQDYNDIIASYNPRNNITKNILSKYEKTKIIGMRMEQLARNSAPYVTVEPGNFNPLKIAEQELMERKIPFMVSRKLPNGIVEYWRLCDMLIF